jgi:hypothetical protein
MIPLHTPHLLVVYDPNINLHGRGCGRCSGHRRPRMRRRGGRLLFRHLHLLQLVGLRQSGGLRRHRYLPPILRPPSRHPLPLLFLYRRFPVLLLSLLLLPLYAEHKLQLLIPRRADDHCLVACSSRTAGKALHPPARPQAARVSTRRGPLPPLRGLHSTLTGTGHPSTLIAPLLTLTLCGNDPRTGRSRRPGISSCGGHASGV